ncbi:hypothetical protein JW930_06780 [Candidatus Woesearchaeota archaeon]|nr:hypothetical protein [Candidatus Woesearchaeota archaeon]
MPFKRKKSKKSSSKKIINARPENYFILITGVPLKNIKELVNALENMNDWVFRHHVNSARNDFYTWIKEVLRESTLAQDISTANDSKEMEYKILRYLVDKYV